MEELIHNLGINWKLLLAQVVNFFLLLLLLRKFLYKPIFNILDERKKKIEEGVKNAEEAKVHLEKAEEKKAEVIETARNEAYEIVSNAREEERAILETARSEAEKEADRVKSKAEEDLEKEKKAMEEALRNETADLVIKGIEKVLREEIDKEKEEAIIRSTLKNA